MPKSVTCWRIGGISCSRWRKCVFCFDIFVPQRSLTYSRKTASERTFLRLRHRKTDAFSLYWRAEHSLIYGRRRRVNGRGYVTISVVPSLLVNRTERIFLFEHSLRNIRWDAVFRLMGQMSNVEFRSAPNRKRIPRHFHIAGLLTLGVFPVEKLVVHHGYLPRDGVQSQAPRDVITLQLGVADGAKVTGVGVGGVNLRRKWQ